MATKISGATSLGRGEMRAVWTALLFAAFHSAQTSNSAFVNLRTWGGIGSPGASVTARRNVLQPYDSSSGWRVVRFGRGRSSVLALCASSEDWMFASVRGDESNKNAFEIGLIAPPFGDVLVVGKRYELQLPKSSDQLLVKKAFDQGKDIAYGVGLASTSGSFANSQKFVAGASASRLKILSVREDESGRGTGVSCSVVVLSRVLIKEIKHMRPYFVVSAVSLRDFELRDELLGPTNDLRVSTCLPL